MRLVPTALLTVFCLVLPFSLKLYGQEYEDNPALRKDPIWYKHYESRRFLSNALSLDKTGNIYTGGSFESYFATPDTTYEIPRGPFRETFANQIWLQKHDQQGNLQWTNYAIGQARLHAIANDKEENVYICGEVWSDALVFVSADGSRDSLDKPGNYHRGAYVAKFNSAGQLLKSYYFSLNRHENFSEMLIDSKGNLILGGNYMYSQKSELKRSYLLLKLKSNLEPLWVMDGDTLGRTQITALALDGSDNTYLAGAYGKDVKIGDQHLSSPHQSQKPFIAKLKKDGELVWLQGAIVDTLNPHSQMIVSGMALDFWRNIYISGTRYDGRFYLAKLKRNSDLAWTTGMRPSNRSNYPFGMIEKDNKELLIFGHGYGGSFFSSPPVDTLSYMGKGSTDFFIGEYSKKGKIVNFQFGGGRGTDYLTAMAFRDGKIYALGHDLGGSPVEFGQKQIGEAEHFTYLKRGPVMWLACFEWGD